MAAVTGWGVFVFAEPLSKIPRRPGAHQTHLKPGGSYTLRTTQNHVRQTKMILRPREGLLASVAVISVTLFSTAPAVVSGAPVVVTDYKQLVGTIGSNDEYATGERFTR